MTVTIGGFRYSLSNDYATDTGQSFCWDESTPDCPQCKDPLSFGAGWAHVCTPDSTNRMFLVCTGCEWQAPIEDAV